MKKYKKYNVIFLIFMISILLFGCESNSTNNMKIVENFAGSGGPGDFYKIKLNMTDKTITYNNLTTGEGGKETYVEYENNLFKINNTTYFAKLNDEIAVVGDEDMPEGEGLMTVLKDTKSAYGDEIGGIYNVATSAEGWVGTVEINPDSKTLDVKLDIDYNGSFAPYDESNGFEQETLPTLDYEYNNEYDAIEIIESDDFKHYGVFVNNQIGVFDSYMWNSNEQNWDGDGMFVLVKQDNNVELSDYEGDYYAVDIDGTVDSYSLKYNSGILDIYYNGVYSEQSVSTQDEKFPGVFEFTFDDEPHRMMVLPGKAMVVAYKGIKEQGTDNYITPPGLFVGVKSD